MDHFKLKELPHPKVKVKLVGRDGNAYAILGRMQAAMHKAGWSHEEITEFLDNATSGDYNHLLAVCMKYAEVS